MGRSIEFGVIEEFAAVIREQFEAAERKRYPLRIDVSVQVRIIEDDRHDWVMVGPVLRFAVRHSDAAIFTVKDDSIKRGQYGTLFDCERWDWTGERPIRLYRYAWEENDCETTSGTGWTDTERSGGPAWGEQEDRGELGSAGASGGFGEAFEHHDPDGDRGDVRRPHQTNSEGKDGDLS